MKILRVFFLFDKFGLFQLLLRFWGYFEGLLLVYTLLNLKKKKKIDAASTHVQWRRPLNPALGRIGHRCGTPIPRQCFPSEIHLYISRVWTEIAFWRLCKKVEEERLVKRFSLVHLYRIKLESKKEGHFIKVQKCSSVLDLLLLRMRTNQGKETLINK